MTQKIQIKSIEHLNEILGKEEDEFKDFVITNGLFRSSKSMYKTRRGYRLFNLIDDKFYYITAKAVRECRDAANIGTAIKNGTLYYEP